MKCNTTKQLDSAICKEFNIVARIDGSDFDEHYEGGYIYIIRCERNAYRIFNHVDNHVFGLQSLLVSWLYDGKECFDDACDLDWWVDEPFDDITHKWEDKNWYMQLNRLITEYEQEEYTVREN